VVLPLLAVFAIYLALRINAIGAFTNQTGSVPIWCSEPVSDTAQSAHPAIQVCRSLLFPVKLNAHPLCDR
jgi:hypothetical protein